ncbi:hypothetical protein D3C74_400650 [compost metagenome]
MPYFAPNRYFSDRERASSSHILCSVPFFRYSTVYWPAAAFHLGFAPYWLTRLFCSGREMSSDDNVAPLPLRLQSRVYSGIPRTSWSAGTLASSLSMCFCTQPSEATEPAEAPLQCSS